MSTPADLNELMSLISSSEFGLTKEKGRLILEDIKSLETAFTTLGAEFKSELMKEAYKELKDQVLAGMKTFKAVILIGADLA